jgi:hypothetical protein
MDYKEERKKNLDEILDSTSKRKVVVGGPGTGKSYLFGELIKKKQKEGKNKFLAITFVGKLGDALADDLCGLTETMTMHGFARNFMVKHYKLQYYPKMYEIIEEDLRNEGIKSFKIGDSNYNKKTKYYNAVGERDVIDYVVEIFKKDKNKIPLYDLILIDEYQDFNKKESELVDLLSEKNEIVIVGDDDQALYGFKGASPRFIREKYDTKNKFFESHMLCFCSRCTEVIIKYFDKIIDKYNLNKSNGRIKKNYICYLPDKEIDSKNNPKINLVKGCPPGMIAYKIQKALESIYVNQKIKDVLIIGESRTCEALLRVVAGQLKNHGFKNVDYHGDVDIFGINQRIIDAYKFIAKDESSLLGWRVLGNPTDKKVKNKHIKNSKTLKKIIEGGPRDIHSIKDKDIDDLEEEIEEESHLDKDIRKKFLFQKIKYDNLFQPRPLCNLNITICNILNSKGLGADIVFLIGFDQGRFPEKETASDSEIYQMLVSLTRAKKRIYLINTIKKKVSNFANCLESEFFDIEEVKLQKY